MAFKLPPKSATPAAHERTPLEKALAAVEPIAAGETALGIMYKLTRNVQGSPREPKYRKLNPSNAKIAEMLAAGGAAVLAELGWEHGMDGEDKPALLLPIKTQCTMAQVRAIDDATAAHKKRCQEERARLARKAAAENVTGDKARLLAQMEADKAERAAQGPVTSGSKAQDLKGGANIMTAKEGGCCGSSGGS